MEKVTMFFNYLCENYSEVLVVGAIMVSAIIVFIGLLKPLVFNRIKWKPLRKSILAMLSVGCSFGATAIHYLWQGIAWDYYIHASVAVALLTIFTYWLYENTCLRDLIDKIGSLTIRKFVNVLTMVFDDKDKAEIRAEVEKVQAEIRQSTKNELKKASKSLKKDKELENL